MRVSTITWLMGALAAATPMPLLGGVTGKAGKCLTIEWTTQRRGSVGCPGGEQAVHYDFTVRNSCSDKIEFHWEDNSYDREIGPKYTQQASVYPGRLLRRSVDCVSVGGSRMKWCADFSDGELRRQDVYCPEYIAGAGAGAPKPATGEEPKLGRAKRLLIQKALAALGFDPGTFDGVFGPQTRTAINGWQRSRGHNPTGRLTSVQAESLLRSAPATEPFGPNWTIAANQPCQVHNSFPTAGETVIWSGGCVDGKASGQGRLVWRGSYGEDVYVGGMRDGKEHGHGTYTFAEGGRYEGELRDGMRHGRGTETYPDGGRYEGEWRNDKPDGYGILTAPDGFLWDGQWRAGCLGKKNSLWATLSTSAAACGFE